MPDPMIPSGNPGTPAATAPTRVGTAWIGDGTQPPSAVPVYASLPGGVAVTSGGFVDPPPPGHGVLRIEMDQPVPKSADERLAGAVAALARIDEIAAPILPVDVFEVLVDVRTALEA